MPNTFSLIFCAQFLFLCMKEGSCTCMPLTSMLTLHPPFEKSGYGPGVNLVSKGAFTRAPGPESGLESGS